MSTRPTAFVACLALALSGVLIDASGPSNGSLLGYVARQAGCFVWALFWLGRAFRWRKWGAGLLLEMALVYVTATLVRTEAPMRVRFALSEAALTRYATAVQRGATPPPSWVGLYRVHRVTRTESGGVELGVEYGVWRVGSFVYATVPPVSESAFTAFTQLRPHWYAHLDSD